MGSGFSGARTTPSPPRPPEGLGPPRGAFEPGARRGSPPSAGGAQRQRSGPGRTQPARGGGGAPGAVGAVRWGGQLPEGHARAHSHTYTHVHTHTRAHTRTPPPCSPGTCSSLPRAARAIKGCWEAATFYLRGYGKAAFLNVHLMTPYPCTDRPAKALDVLYTRDSGAQAVAPCLSQELRASGCGQWQGSKVNPEAG